MMLSALRIVDSRCATTTVVRSCMSPSRADWTSFSLVASSAEVASSRRRMRGLLMMARAIAMRCFSPPLICRPRSPHCVWYLSGSPLMKRCAFEARHASRTSSSVASSLPYRTFSRIETAKSTGSCETSLICCRSHLTFNSLTSTPSIRTVPPAGS
mmetsp:Transcript_58422/g.137527  ORF Transcript_58422/g.137527 Transcript_58422/m.137527 type:complete len:156 (-) Transcript_58422:1347-1814(-)